PRARAARPAVRRLGRLGPRARHAPRERARAARARGAARRERSRSRAGVRGRRARLGRAVPPRVRCGDRARLSRRTPRGGPRRRSGSRRTARPGGRGAGRTAHPAPFCGVDPIRVGRENPATPLPNGEPPMATIYHDSDADLSALAGQTVAVVGYGNQGRSQALNLRDAGVDVVVGNIRDYALDAAEADGFRVRPIAEACAAASCAMLLIPDEVMPAVYAEHVAPQLGAGGLVSFASGDNAA